ARLQGNRAAVNAIEQLLRFVLEADLAALERIDQQLHGFPVVANQEVPGEVDTVQRQPEAPADLEVEQAERERHAGATIEDVVQERVARVVVCFRIAAEPFLLEQYTTHFLQHDERRGLVVEAITHALGQHVDAREVRLWQELRVLLGRDQQCCEGKVDVLVLLCDDSSEPRSWRRRRCGAHPDAAALASRSIDCRRAGSACRSRVTPWTSAVDAAFGNADSISAPPSWSMNTTLTRKPCTPVP